MAPSQGPGILGKTLALLGCSATRDYIPFCFGTFVIRAKVFGKPGGPFCFAPFHVS